MGEIMIKLNKMYYKAERAGNKLTFNIANYKVDDNYDCDAFKLNGEEKDFLYISVYNGAIDTDNKLKFMSGMVPDTGSIDKYIEAIQNKIGNYGIMSYASYSYLYILLCIITRSRFRVSNNRTDILKNGTADAEGPFFNDLNNEKGNKVFGIENLWGNIWEYLDGLIQYNEKLLYTPGTINNNNDSIIKQINDSTRIKSDGYISKIDIIDKVLIPSELNGSSSTGFSAYNKYNVDIDTATKNYFSVSGFVNNISNIFNISNNTEAGIRLICYPN